jgi:hypothetical protein
VRYAPITDPAVATAAYSYHGLRWLAARIAVKMSGPPNVGSGELSTMAREKSPNAPKWRNIEVKPWPQRGVACWRKMFNTNPLYQLCWAAFGSSRSSSGSYALRFSERLRVEESAFNRATGATSTTEQSRRAAKSARWGGLLTFDGKGEIIIVVGRNRSFCPQI